MVERVYAQPSPAALPARLRLSVGLEAASEGEVGPSVVPEVCPTHADQRGLRSDRPSGTPSEGEEGLQKQRNPNGL